jgi:hypothetical protein
MNVSTTAIAETILSRLEGVRRSGNAWIARCPAHKDKSPSLSIAIGHDGRILVHCFAGCAVHLILSALGLQLNDLFAQRLLPATHEETRALRESARRSAWDAALGVLARESTVIQIGAEMIGRHETPTPEDIERLHVASCRIHDARQVLAL